MHCCGANVRQPQTLPPEVAASIRQCRLEAGLSVREAARRAGISPGFLWDLEHARRAPSLGTVVSLLRTLDFTDSQMEALCMSAVLDAGRYNPFKDQPLTHRA